MLKQKHEQQFINQVKKFRQTIEPCWCEETAHKSRISQAREGKSIGQCGVTSLLLREYLIAKVPELRIKVARGKVLDAGNKELIPYHVWLEIADINNQRWNLDTALDQSVIKMPVYYDLAVNPKCSEIKYKCIEYLDLANINEDFKRRFLILKQRVLNKIENQCLE